MQRIIVDAWTVAEAMQAYLQATDAIDTCFPQPLGGVSPTTHDPYQYRILVSPVDQWTVQHGLMLSPCWVYRETSGEPQWIREYKTLIQARNALELLCGSILTIRKLSTNDDGSHIFSCEERTRPYSPDFGAT